MASADASASIWRSARDGELSGGLSTLRSVPGRRWVLDGKGKAWPSSPRISITQEMGADPTHVMMPQIMALFDEYQSEQNAKHMLRALKENAR
jgi:hypothetical protein